MTATLFNFQDHQRMHLLHKSLDNVREQNARKAHNRIVLDLAGKVTGRVLAEATHRVERRVLAGDSILVAVDTVTKWAKAQPGETK